MFGRHPRPAIDAFSECISKEHYARKLKKWLDFAYKVSSKEANKNASRHKFNYDGEVRAATLGEGTECLFEMLVLKAKANWQIGRISILIL